MKGDNHSYDKYLSENNQFFYDEQSSKGTFLKQDSELFNDEDDIPGQVVMVKRITKPSENWQVYVDKKEYLLLRGTRFTSAEREFLRSVQGILFVIDGTKRGWKSVSEFKRQIQDKL